MARYKIPFWLDSAKAVELELLETICDLKRARVFTSTIRDGIRLIVDLRAGRLDVLVELFPWVKEALEKPTNSNNGGDDWRNEFDSLKKLILEQNTIPAPPADYPVMKPGGLKPLPGLKPLSKPVFDDDGDLPALAVKKDTNTDAGRNLINSMMGLQ